MPDSEFELSVLANMGLPRRPARAWAAMLAQPGSGVDELAARRARIGAYRDRVTGCLAALLEGSDAAVRSG